MGLYIYHAIIVTSWNRELMFDEVYPRALKVFPWGEVSSLARSRLNGRFSFLVGPDGSSETYPESNLGDRQRDEFVDYLNSLRFEDGSPRVEWVEIAYGSDAVEFIGPRMTRHPFPDWWPGDKEREEAPPAPAPDTNPARPLRQADREQANKLDGKKVENGSDHGMIETAKKTGRQR